MPKWIFQKTSGDQQEVSHTMPEKLNSKLGHNLIPGHLSHTNSEAQEAMLMKATPIKTTPMKATLKKATPIKAMPIKATPGKATSGMGHSKATQWPHPGRPYKERQSLGRPWTF